jgi:hypothetical protein
MWRLSPDEAAVEELELRLARLKADEAERGAEEGGRLT